jgi:hypothetical protein
MIWHISSRRASSLAGSFLLVVKQNAACAGDILSLVTYNIQFVRNKSVPSEADKRKDWVDNQHYDRLILSCPSGFYLVLQDWLCASRDLVVKQMQPVQATFYRWSQTTFNSSETKTRKWWLTTRVFLSTPARECSAEPSYTSTLRKELSQYKRQLATAG